MKRLTIPIGLVLAAVAGCETTEMTGEQFNQADRWLVAAPRQTSRELALVSQRTIFPHHFVLHGSALSELGKADVKTLALHYKAYPGTLNIRRGTASLPLYDARIATALEAMAAHGVDRDRLSVVDALPDGGGMASEQVVVILANQELVAAPDPARQSRRTSRTGGMQ